MPSNTFFPRPDQSSPWSFSLAFGVLLLYLVAIPCAVQGVVYFFEDRFPVFEETDDENAEPPIVAMESTSPDSAAANPEEESTLAPEQVAMQHPLARLLIRSRATPYFRLVVALFFIAVVCLAPLAEEFVFRVVLQGTTQSLLQVDAPLPRPDAQTSALPSAEISLRSVPPPISPAWVSCRRKGIQSMWALL